MGQARARPGARTVIHEIVRGGSPGSARDQGRADIAIAKLGADHLVGLALLHLGDAREFGARLRALRRVVADVRPPHGAPFAPPQRGEARSRDVACRRPGAARSRRSAAGSVRPSPAASRRASTTDRWRRRRPCSCRARRSGSRDARRRRRGRRGPRHNGRRAAGSAATARRRALVLHRHRRPSARTSSPSSASLSTSDAGVKCLVESCTIRNVALLSAT